MWMSSRKSEYRDTKTWKEFAYRLRSELGECELCHRRDLQLQVHHLDPEHYDDLSDDAKYLVLCPACHEYIEGYGVTPRLFRLMLWQEYLTGGEPYERLRTMYNELKDYKYREADRQQALKAAQAHAKYVNRTEIDEDGKQAIRKKVDTHIRRKDLGRLVRIYADSAAEPELRELNRILLERGIYK